MIKNSIFRWAVAFVFVCSAWALSAQKFSFNHPDAPAGLQLVTASKGNVSIRFAIAELELTSVQYRGEEMSEINLSGAFIPNDQGMPNLPRFSRFIAIPQGAEARVNVRRNESEVIQNVNIAPALELQIENAEPKMDYVKNEKIYRSNRPYPETTIELSETTSIRGVDAVVLGITPFQYNPVTKELTVYHNIEVDVTFEGGNGIIGNDRYRSRWFDPILANTFINYESLPKIDYEQRFQNLRDVEEGCEYLIVIPNNEAWRPYAEQIRDYRTRQGIITKVMSLNEMGCTTTTQMKTFFHNAYNTWEIPPVAVLLMADHGTDMNNRIPAETISHPYEGSCITDNQYADVTGDKLPEMVFSRMTAENTDHLQVMVSKVLEYEYEMPCMDPDYYQNPITALGWQTERWFQLCSEVVGGYLRSVNKTPVRINAIYSGTPGSSWSSNQNTNAVVSYFGPNGTGYIPQTPSEMGGWTGGTAQQVVNAINDGAFILQHRDHGFEQGWGEPDFQSSNIAQLNNVGKLPFIFSINCLTGKFNISGSCFAEVFHRHTYNGQNAGAIGVLCPTETSYSFVNDTYIWGVYDLFQPDFLPTFGPYATNSGNWMPAFGNVAGKYFLYQSSWPYNAQDKDITYQMFTTHADAFLRLYSEVPQTLDVTHAPTIFAGATTVTVNCEEGALIALTVNGEILAVAEATGGAQNITILPQIPATEILVTCTKQNYLRHESTITVVPAEGPYVIGYEWIVEDENGNGIMEYTENGYIHLTAKNVGIETANSVVINVSSEDPYITFDKSSENFGEIAPENTVLRDNAFSFSIAQDVPNNHTITLKLQATDGTEVWDSYLSFKAFAPIMEFDGNSVFGDILAGSTLDITARFRNKGGAPMYSGNGFVSCENEYITLNNSNFNYGNIDAGGVVEGIFNITINENAPENERYDFHTVLMGNHQISAEGDFSIQNVCNVVFDLHDSYGDGWNGNKLRVTFSDGTPQVEYTISSGNSATYTKSINVGTTVSLTWVNGQWPQECSFTVSYEDGDLIYASSGTPTAGLMHQFVCNCNGEGGSCNPIENLIATVDGTTVELTWDEIPEATSYLVKRNGVDLESVSVAEYTDENLFVGNYNYDISAVYQNGCVTLPTRINVMITLCTSVSGLTSTLVEENNTTVELMWNSTEDAAEYRIYLNNQLIGNTTENHFVVEDLAWETEYCFAVAGVCEDGESQKVITCITTPYEPCYVPIELVATVEEEMTIQLTWDPVNTANMYDVFRDGEKIATSTRARYTDNNLEIGTYCYTVQAKCEHDDSAESESSCGTVVSIDELTASLRLFPNPANNAITIEGENVKNITVYNALGQRIYSQELEQNRTIQINTEQWNSGFYLFHIEDQNGQTVVKRVSVIH